MDRSFTGILKNDTFPRMNSSIYSSSVFFRYVDVNVNHPLDLYLPYVKEKINFDEEVIVSCALFVRSVQ